MMNSYIFVMALICEAVAIRDFPDFYDVGTVLFFPSDTNKLRWSNAEIGLLNARKLFLELLPPPDILIQDNHFANSILSYFKDTYNVVKRDAMYNECGSLLMTALSDTLGGFMRVWILPITKLGFYAGTVPQDDALRLFQFYEDIKKYLKTDGKGWHKPNIRYVNFVPANVAPIPIPSSRNSPDPCNALAYFEKTTQGLSIPVPKIIWQEGSESMFLPLKNHTLISLNSPNSSTTLFEYYDTAKNCIKANQMRSIRINSSTFEDGNSYDERFQYWLMTDVIPHLDDEKLYPALRSVLALAKKNSTRYDHLMNRYVQFPPPNKKCTTGTEGELPSKKMMIIAALILLEIAWCIPTLCYLGCTTHKKRKHKGNLFYYVKSKNPLGIWAESTQCNTTVRATRSASTEKTPVDSKKPTSVTQHPEKANCKIGTYDMDRVTLHSIGTATRRNCKCQLCPNFMANNCNHRTNLQRRSSKIINATQSVDNFAPVRKPSFRKPELSPDNFFGLLNKEEESKTASVITVQELRPINTTVTVRDNYKSKAKITEIVSYVDETLKTTTTNNKKESKRPTENTFTCSKKDCKKRQMLQHQSSKPTKKEMKHSDRHQIREPEVSSHSQKDLITFKRGIRLPGKPFLEIIIDRPQRNVPVEIGVTRPAKPSKIPKRFNTNTQTQVPQLQSKIVQNYGKSLIPKPKGHGTLDDIIINRNNVVKNVKLNVSL